MTQESSRPLRLDDLYKMTAFIYGDRNSVRSRESTFAHFVEVCGMLTLPDRKKKRTSFDMTDALCKALGWYFPLLAKLQVRSVETLVYRKFPGVCPYCRKAPHEETACKLVKGTTSTVNHEEVIEHFTKSYNDRPHGLDDWQRMFNRIYPRSVNESGRSSIGLMEELGELAEAVRVFDIHPHYFLGEAADTFSYLMGLANEHAIREAQEDRNFSFEAEFLSRYPGLCTQCGSKICVCPSIPAATVGRMAKELGIGVQEALFISNLNDFNSEGERAAQSALENMGGYTGLVEKLPFDRGEANHSLVQLCLKIAAATEQANPELASSLHAQAIRIGEGERAAGTPRTPQDNKELIGLLKDTWKQLDEAFKQEIKGSTGLVGELGEILDTTRILFVSCNPTIADGSHLRLESEQRVIREAIQAARPHRKISLELLPAATIEDVRKELLRREYDIIHFSGHANETALIFETADNEPVSVPLEAIAQMVGQYPSTKCVILNACQSTKALTKAISPITIGMQDSIPDDTAITFSRGFYDALGQGRAISRAYDEGILAVNLSDSESDFIRLIQ